MPTESKDIMHWFQYRTLRKVPGMFQSDFWNTLLLQASAAEPAVRHSILALSAIHRRGITLERKDPLNLTVADGLRQSGWRHYVEAIHQLRQRASSRDKSAIRVIIITCIVFVCLELFQGHLSAAQAHVRSGTALLRETGWYSEHNEPTEQALGGLDSDDKWILEGFGRIHLHDELFNLIFLNQLPANRERRRDVANHHIPSLFRYREDAWSSLDRLLLSAIHLTQDCKIAFSEGKHPASDRTLLARRHSLQTDLKRWAQAFPEPGQPPAKFIRAAYDESLALIEMTRNLTIILVETCLVVDDETVYDAHTKHFVDIMASTGGLMKIWMENVKHLQIPDVREVPHLMSFSIIDVCAMPAMYFTATKCRVNKIRLQALAALGPMRQRESHWDGGLTYRVARKVVELENSYVRSTSRTAQEAQVVPGDCRLQRLRVVPKADPLTSLCLEFELVGTMGGVQSHSVSLDAERGVWSDELSDDIFTYADADE
ncbi:fungal specific transcription factor domain-containing protein [Sarocladium implicatum]|nr:fungal specific transcription factor domain-containing protein [Sarocladium implicatum]